MHPAPAITRPAAYPVIELRRYTLVDGAARAFARHFETWFPEAFQQLGALTLGHFCERGGGDRFTWLRAYPDMAARKAVNTAFYDGPVWREHRATVNRWIVDSDNVLLLRPLYPGSEIPALPAVDPLAEPDGARGLALAHVFQVQPGRLADAAAAADAWFAAYHGKGVVEAGILATLDEANNFPRHPIRTDGTFLVWLGVLRDDAALAALLPACNAASAALQEAGLLAAPAELLVLDPSERSRLRWMAPPAHQHPA
jgi:hypothetical protein